MVRSAVSEHITLSKRNVLVLPHGSYANNTAVRQESDVDVVVINTDQFFYDFSMADGFGKDDVGFEDADFTYAQFKNQVEEALVDKFGQSGVTRGKIAFDVHENTYRVDADVVACFRHRRYTVREGRDYRYEQGVEFFSDDGQQVINWPEQHYDNGVAKNRETGTRFKQLVRIIKRLRNDMDEEGIPEAKPIPSFLIECLVWNVPNVGFGHTSLKDDVQYGLAHLFNETRSFETCTEWGEINELKYLFRTSQPWTREQANSFLNAAWDYVGFE
jgi:tRNA nucleotidyltransferase (CCA-adding enzyme)